jgi:hypothetical protein
MADYIQPYRSFVPNDLLASDDLTRPAATVAINKKSWVDNSPSKQTTNRDRVERSDKSGDTQLALCSLFIVCCSLFFVSYSITSLHLEGFVRIHFTVFGDGGGGAKNGDIRKSIAQWP